MSLNVRPSRPPFTLLNANLICSDNGQSVVAEVVERCAGCTGPEDLILNAAAYQALTGSSTGGMIQVDWFVDVITF